MVVKFDGEYRKCPSCHEIKIKQDFIRRLRGRDIFTYRCYVCRKRLLKEAWQRRFAENPYKIRKQFADAMRRFKESAVNMYSNGDACCKWCKQADMDVLCLDHINDDGAAHRFQMKQTQQNVYQWARKNDYPPMFQVLCFNCNAKKLALYREKCYLENRPVPQIAWKR